MSKFNKIAYILLIIGGLNWGIIGLFNINLIDSIFSHDVARIIYSFIGVAALVGLYHVAGTRSRDVKKK